MKQKILLTIAIAAFTVSTQAQKKQKATTAYAITSLQKGNSNWTEVKLVDVKTGEEVQSVYQSKEEVPVLNARTGKAVVKKDATTDAPFHIKQLLMNKDLKNLDELKQLQGLKDIKEIRVEQNASADPTHKRVMVYHFENKNIATNVNVATNVNKNIAVNVQPVAGVTAATTPTDFTVVTDQPNNVIRERRVISIRRTVQTDKPFSTNSAACAYDKKHDRLYYTPMGINQLRYIDLKSKTAEVYYFEDEAFGVVTGSWDGQNQITRMVIASDHNGYALSNNGEHLIKFTTDKKSQITDLGSLSDDANNGKYSIHSTGGYGGDMVADDKGALYLITASRVVFKIDVDTKVATYKGTIQGLPRGFSTNGAVVESGTNIIVSSATSTSGYYMFDLNTMQADKVSTGETVFNASDLANGNLISEKKKKKEKQLDEVKPEEPKADEATTAKINRRDLKDVLLQNNLSIYPNPASLGSSVKISFGEQPTGKYSIQFMDISGKMVDTRQVTIGSKMQVENYKLPTLIGKGSYLVKVVNETGKVVGINTIIVQ